MAQNSNSHDAPWLINSQIPNKNVFNIYAGNARSSCLVVAAGTETSVIETVKKINGWLQPPKPQPLFWLRQLVYAVS